MTTKLPSFQFYPGDWLKDPALRSVSYAARGLWTDMLCLMHESVRRGYLQHVTDKPVTTEQLARMTGGSAVQVSRLLRELKDSGVFSCTEHGIIYSRRIVRDEEIRQARASSGHLGGNPELCENYNRPGYVYLLRRKSDNAIKIGIATNPTNRLYKIRSQNRDDEITLMDSIYVSDMGNIELKAHNLFNEKKIKGEWFALTQDDISTLKGKLKGGLKGEPTPSSSSSSSSSSSKKERTPLPPKGGNDVFLQDLPENKTANDLSPQEKSALLEDTEPAEDENDDGHSLPPDLQNILKSIAKTKDIESGKGEDNLFLPLQGGNPEKIPKNSPVMTPANSEVSNVAMQPENPIMALSSPKNGQYTERFETIWQMYPAQSRIGKKLAFKHFQPSVKTTDDFALIKQALSNYLGSKRVKNGYVQNGDTWFNNWRDWIYYEEIGSTVYDEDLIRDSVTGEVKYDSVTGKALRVKRDPATGKIIGSRWYRREPIVEAKK